MVIRAESRAKSQNSEAFLESMEKMFGDHVTIEGGVEVEVKDGVRTLRGNRLHVDMYEDMSFYGDQGELKILADDRICFHFLGNARLSSESFNVVADKFCWITEDSHMTMEYSGSVKIEILEGDGEGRRFSADRVVVDPQRSGVHLLGNARLYQQGDKPLDIRAEYIQIDDEYNAVKSASSIPSEVGEIDVFSFYLGISR